MDGEAESLAAVSGRPDGNAGPRDMKCSVLKYTTAWRDGGMRTCWPSSWTRSGRDFSSLRKQLARGYILFNSCNGKSITAVKAFSVNLPKLEVAFMNVSLYFLFYCCCCLVG